MEETEDLLQIDQGILRTITRYGMTQRRFTFVKILSVINQPHILMRQSS